MSFYAWGLTELTVNSCFFDTPPRAYLNYNIYILIFICVWGEPCIFGVLTVNLLTPDADNEGDERASMKTEPRHH